jgi:hypothetical protein
MGLMPTRKCRDCGQNRHVKVFIEGSDLCPECRAVSGSEHRAGEAADTPGMAIDPTRFLDEFAKKQALTNPGLAEKQRRLIQGLREKLGSDQAVFDALSEIFGTKR